MDRGPSSGSVRCSCRIHQFSSQYPHRAAHNFLNSGSRGSDALFWTRGGGTLTPVSNNHTDTHTHAHAVKNKNRSKWKQGDRIPEAQKERKLLPSHRAKLSVSCLLTLLVSKFCALLCRALWLPPRAYISSGSWLCSTKRFCSWAKVMS